MKTRRAATSGIDSNHSCTGIHSHKALRVAPGQVNSLDDMDVVHRKMESLGPLHHRNSVHAYEHMPVFETVITALLVQVRGRGGPSDTVLDSERRNRAELRGRMRV